MEPPVKDSPKVVTDTPLQEKLSIKKIVFYRILCLILGGVFVVSGFSKAVDPWGGLYKIQEYFAAWGMDFSHEFCLIAACLLSGFELLLGVLLILGCFRRLLPWIAMVFMSFMTLLTLYIWIADPVSDCGCFGDFLRISNGMTFAKNLILLGIALLLVGIRKKPCSLIRPKLQWLVLIFTGAYVIAIQIYGYNVQPLIDFRPYPVGTNLEAILSRETEDANLKFIYEKDGEEVAFDADNLPDESWTFVRRETTSKTESEEISIFDGEEEVTADVIEPEGEQYVLLISNPQRYGISRSEMANRLYEDASRNDKSMIAVIALNPDSIGSWKAKTGARYPVYSAEDTDIKMLARGDAAIMALNDGVIQWKSNIYALPPEFPEGEMSTAQLMAEGREHPLAKFTVVWVVALFVVYVLSRFSLYIAEKTPKAPSSKAYSTESPETPASPSNGDPQK